MDINKLLHDLAFESLVDEGMYSITEKDVNQRILQVLKELFKKAA